MEIDYGVLGLALLAVLAVGAGLVWQNQRRAAAANRQNAELAAAQQQLAGQLNAIAANSAAAQEAIGRTLNERLDQVSKRLGDSLAATSEKTTTSLGELQKRLALIDSAQKNIAELSSRVVDLQDVLANKQARGAFGEVQLNDIVRNALPPSAYEFQATLGNGRRVDCLIKMPNPPGPIAIDAKFPLESYHQLRQANDDTARTQAARGFTADLQKHIVDIAERYIVAGETAESALMFLPSEAVYAELHASFPAVVERSYRARVWIVSPTTLWATLNTVRAVLKDTRTREQAGVIQTQVHELMSDIVRLDTRVANLQRHFGQAEKDLREIDISAGKITQRAERIEALQLDDGGGDAESESDAEAEPSPAIAAPVEG